MAGPDVKAAGRAVRAARLAQGLTQKRLAALLAEEFRLHTGPGATCEQSTVSSWESGRKTPTPKRVAVIEAVLGIDAGTLQRLYFGVDPDLAATRMASPRELVARLRNLVDQLDRLLGDDPAHESGARGRRTVRRLQSVGDSSPGTDTPGTS